MDYVTLGGTGLKVSRLCLGCMSFGTPGWEVHPWVLDEQASMAYFKRALEAGINFFDTADYYSRGASEVIAGKALGEYSRREEVVIATKLGLDMKTGPNGVGLSRKHIREAIDASLKRLGTDYVDILYIHRLDPDTPPEEVMEALDQVVKAGKVLYLGASSMWAWQFASMRTHQKANGLAEFAVMQNFYNLIYREEEREMNPYCDAHNVALVPWSPIARGFLAGNRPKQGQATQRASTDKLAEGYFGSKQDYAILARVQKVAEKLGVSPAQVALAWVLAKVTSPIVGSTKMAHLDDAVAALDIELDAQTMAALEAPYKPREVIGHS